MSDDEIANLTVCPCCKQTYTDPCQLPCRDTLCKKCFFALEAAASQADPDQQVRRCPVCDRECLANGGDLKPDNRAAWMVRSRKASIERQQRETAKGRCSLPHCGESAISKGYYFEGTLCGSHVRTDEEKFAEIKLTAQSLLQKVRGLTKQRKDALADLQTERADTAELLDAIEARLQNCRKATLGRLDTAIEKLKLELRAVDFIEKLQIEIQDAERVGDHLLSSRLFKQLHLSLADVDVNAGWASAADETVELAQHLLTTVDTISADVENGKGAFVRSCLELREPICQDVYTRGIAPLAVAACTSTDGFYYNPNSGALTKDSQQAGVQPLPTRFVAAFGKKEGGYFAAAPNPRELLAQYYDSFGKFCGQFSLELPPGASLLAVECASRVQRMFLLVASPAAAAAASGTGSASASASAASKGASSPSTRVPTQASTVETASAEAATADGSSTAAPAPAAPTSPTPALTRHSPSASEVIVTDLAGTQLRTLRDLQLSGGPARGMTCCGDYLSSVCIYVLGDAGQLACLSAADNCQLQECIELPDEVRDARSVAASGRRLVLATPRTAQLMSPVTKTVSKVVSVGDKEAELKRVEALGCGLVGVCDASRWICFAARTGATLRTYRGAADPSCIGRLEFGCLRFFAVRPGK